MAAISPVNPVYRKSALFAAAFTVVSWASAFPALRVGLQSFTPIELAAFRNVLAGAVFALAMAATRAPLPTRREALRFVFCGAIGIALYNVLFNFGQRTVSAGAASFLVNTLPIFTAMLSAAVYGERLRPVALLGLVVSFLGVGVLASTQPGGMTLGSGAMFIIAAAICSAVYFVAQRPLLARFSAFHATGWTILAGAACLMPSALSAIAAAAGVPNTAWIVVVFLALVPTAAGFVAWTHVLANVPPARASTFLYLVPPVATLMGVVGLGEQVGATMLLGGLLAMTGVAMVHLSRSRGG